MRAGTPDSILETVFAGDRFFFHIHSIAREFKSSNPPRTSPGTAAEAPSRSEPGSGPFVLLPAAPRNGLSDFNGGLDLLPSIPISAPSDMKFQAGLAVGPHGAPMAISFLIVRSFVSSRPSARLSDCIPQPGDLSFDLFQIVPPATHTAGPAPRAHSRPEQKAHQDAQCHAEQWNQPPPPRQRRPSFCIPSRHMLLPPSCILLT